MPRYIVLENWTDTGIQKYFESPGRLEAAVEAAAKMDVNLERVYWTMGMYDMISVIEAPDDEAISAHMLRDASKGSVRSITLRAFDHDEMSRIIKLAQSR
jgi:uncharacterized protein with GYD domain